MVTVLLASPVPTRIGLALLVRPSVADEPVSFNASCRKSIEATGAVWSMPNEPVAVAVLPATSVVTTCRPTLPSGRPAAGIVPDVGATAPVSSDQWPLASVAAVYASAPPEDGVTVIVT